MVKLLVLLLFLPLALLLTAGTSGLPVASRLLIGVIVGAVIVVPWVISSIVRRRAR